MQSPSCCSSKPLFKVVCAASHLNRYIQDYGQTASLLAIYFKNARFSIPNLGHKPTCVGYTRIHLCLYVVPLYNLGDKGNHVMFILAANSEQ